jgi:opacity protein-like surface antigen
MKKMMIRQSLVATLILFAIASSAIAQTDEKVWSFGPEVGVNFTKFGGDASDSDYRNGILLGIGLTYSIQNTYGITTKVLYSQRGAKMGDIKTSLQYIEVPITGRFFLNRDGKFRPNIFVGPSFAFLTGAASKEGDGDSEDIENYADIFKTFDFGLTGGLGLNWLIANETHIVLDGRYTHGLSDLSKADGKVNNQGFTISAGVTFGL